MSKFSNYGKKARSGYGQYGQGNPIRPDDYPQDIPRRFNSFASGYVSADSREDIPADSSPYAPNMEVDRKDRLTRAPGTTVYEQFATRTPSQMFVHNNLDYRAELILLDPPFVGVKTSGVTTWTDFGLNDLFPYVFTHFGEDLIFSNGINRVYRREPYEDPVEADIPLARTYASFAGRLWGAHIDIGGRIEPLGIRWSSSSADPEDWEGIAAGFELLLDDALAGDRIVALRTLGFDQMAVINRRSIWIGRRTGIDERPADFSPRVPGVGAVNEESVTVTRFGVFLLSDNGVYLFDGNQASLISGPINPDLLPIDYDQIHKYHSFYDPFLKRYYQFTPTDLFIYEVERQRWFHRTYTADSIALFVDQIPQEIWDTDNQAWDLDDTPWDEFSVDDLPRLLMLGTEDALSTVVEEDYDSETAFGLAITPTWEFRLELAEKMSILLTIKGFNIEYEGSGTIRVYVPDNLSQYDLLYEVDLPVATFPSPAYQPVLHTGKGSGARIEYVTGDLKISKAELIIMRRSETNRIGKFVPREYFPDFE